MNNKNSKFSLQKIATGISGFDLISQGGLPKGRTTLVSGTSGSAKTIFACQFLAEGIRRFDESGVFVTFEEHPDDIRRNIKSFNWNIAEWEKQGKWAFVDASPSTGLETAEIGAYDLSALLARIEYAVNKIGARRISLDSLGAIFSKLADSNIVRKELFRIAAAIKKMNLTAILTAERTTEFGEIARFGTEEFVCDNVIVLRNALEDRKRRRTIEILKFRGTGHQKGEWPFIIIPEQGMVIIPLAADESRRKSSNIRITSGISELDKICDGGFFRDSIILVSGPTGTGKTLFVTHFVRGGLDKNEKSLLFSFDESREQLFRNALGWGADYEKMEQGGRLKVICDYPEAAGLEDHLISMKQIIEKFNPTRIAVDSLSSLERIATVKGFREFVIALTSFLKHLDITGLFTVVTPHLVGGIPIAETHISTITDSIVLLHYVEIFGEIHRGMTVLKMRGSMHAKDIREFSIDSKGMHLGKAFKNITGILSGNLVHLPPGEIDRVNALLKNK